MYRAFGKNFTSFEDVVQHAWDTYKIEVMLENTSTGEELTEEEKQECCAELTAWAGGQDD